MIPVSTEYRRQLIAGNRNWLIKVDITLADSTVLHLTNEHIWDNGITLDNAISSDNSFDIGSAIVGSLSVVIDNIKGDFSQYDFYDATLVLWLGVDGDVDEYDVQQYYRIGFYVVDVPTYNGSLITLDCLDNMIWFDTPFDDVTGINWSSATAYSVISAICSHVGVTLGTNTFPNYSTSIPAKPDQQLSCREVLQYIAQMCCCYCKIDRAGELVLTWYDKNAIIGITDYDGGTYHTNTTPYSDGCDLDGGHFHYGGDSADGGTFSSLLNNVVLSQNFQIEVSTDDVVVTGCRVRNNASDETGYDVLWVDPTVEADHERYVLVIDDNPFIINQTQANTIANIVGSTLAGLPMRGFSSTSLADFSYETGDMATIIDFRGNRYYTWITHCTFTTNNSENFSCGVESIKKRSEQRFSTLAEAINKAKVAISAYDTAVKEMDVLAQNAIGYNEYVYNSGSGNVMWRYNGANIDTTDPANPKFQGSTVVFKISGDGIFVAKGDDIAADGTCTFSNGYDANSGTAILNLIYAIGINCDWIHAGTLTLGGLNNVNGVCSVLNSSSVEKVRLDDDGVYAIAGNIGNMTLDSTGLGAERGNLDSTRINANGTFSFTHENDYNSFARLEFKKDGNQCTLGLWTGAGGHGGNGGLDITNAAPDGSGSTWCHWGWDNGELHQSGSSTKYVEWTSGSDRRLKKNIKPLSFNKVRRFFELLNPVKFKYKGEEDFDRFGVIAQEIEEVLQEIKETNTYFVEEKTNRNKDADGNTYVEGVYKYVNYSEFHAWELAAIKDLYELVNAQQKEIAELKARLK